MKYDKISFTQNFCILRLKCKGEILVWWLKTKKKWKHDNWYSKPKTHLLWHSLKLNCFVNNEISNFCICNKPIFRHSTTDWKFIKYTHEDVFSFFFLFGCWRSNPRPCTCQASALPFELNLQSWRHLNTVNFIWFNKL